MVGYGVALAPLKALPREVWAETEGLEAVCTSGAAGNVLSPLDHGSVRIGSLGLQTPWSPERKVLLELRAASFLVVLAAWVWS